jgi:hypothetical protein
MCTELGELALQPINGVVNPTSPDLNHVIEALDLREGGWAIAIVGSHVTREQIIAQNEAWNAQMARVGCVRHGPAIIQGEGLNP